MRRHPFTCAVLVTALLGGGLLASPLAKSEPSTHFEHRFRIDSERFTAGPIEIGSVRGVARGSYSVEVRDDGHYIIRGGMRGTHVAYKTRLSFRSEGRVESGSFMPTHYVARIQHDSVLAEDRIRETRIDFDYARNKAFARATSEKDGRRRVLHDNRATGVAIDRGVKDPISALMDVLIADTPGDVPIRTVVDGVVVRYQLRDRGRRNVTIRGASVPCRVRSFAVPAGAIDRNPYEFTLWSRQGNGQHVLQARIAPAGSSLIAKYERTIQ